jgi:hypothetical protein
MQILRWPTNKSKHPKPKPDSTSTDDGNRPKIVLELQDEADWEPALAVLSSMYAVKPLPELLSELKQEQQLQAALLADMWQVPDVSTAAIQLLLDAMTSDGGLSDGVKLRLMTDPALPDCLQQLMRPVLLSTLGDLEAVWADAGLWEHLLELSLPAMEMLLLSDEIEVS